MAGLHQVVLPANPSALSKAESRGGVCLAYFPDKLAEVDHQVDFDTMSYLVESSPKLLAASNAARNHGALDLLARLEAIASTSVDADRPSAESVVVAELAGRSDDPAAVRAASLYSALLILRDDPGATDLVHAAVDPTSAGVRQVHGFAGGASILNAEYVAPPPESLPEYLDDLLSFSKASKLPQLVTAAVACAQLVSVRPWESGNGVVGRALGWALATEGSLPLSTGFARSRSDYLSSLQEYRYDSEQHSRSEASSVWVQEFIGSLVHGADVVEALCASLDVVLTDWSSRMVKVRADSVLRRVPGYLVQRPAVTASMLAVDLGTSVVTASKAVQELTDLGIVTPSDTLVDRAQVYVATDIVGLLDLPVKMEDPSWRGTLEADALTAPRVVRQKWREQPVCGHLLPLSGSRCVQKPGHRGQH